MSVRPTLLSFAVAILVLLLFAAGVVFDQGRAEPDSARLAAAVAAKSQATSSQASPTKASRPAAEKRGAKGENERLTKGPKETAAPGTPEKSVPAESAGDPADAENGVSERQAAEGEDARKGSSGETAKTEPYRWMARRSDNKIKLWGAVPSEEDQRTVLGMARAQFADLEIADGMKIAGGAPPKEQWLGAVSFALKQLTYIENGNVRLSDVALSMEGRAGSAADYAELRQAVEGSLPTGLSIQKLAVAPPVADPFVFTASLQGNILTLAGNVPDAEMHERLKEIAVSAFRGRSLDDQLVIAAGAPKNWEKAADAALAALSRLQEGEVSLSGDTVKIDGTAADKSTATELSYQLRRDLPSPYRSSENIRWREAGRASDLAETIIPRLKENVDGGASAR